MSTGAMRCGGLRLVPRQPAQLGHGCAGLRHGPDGLAPTRAARRARRPDRRRRPVPACRCRPARAARGALPVQRAQPVLLRGHADGLHPFQQPAGRGLTEGEQPGLRIDLGGLCRPTGCGAYPCRSTAPVSVSQTTMRVNPDELSNPATIPMAPDSAAAAPVPRPLPADAGPPGAPRAVRLGVGGAPVVLAPLLLRSRSERTRWATESGTRSPTCPLTEWYALPANSRPGLRGRLGGVAHRRVLRDCCADFFSCS